MFEGMRYWQKGIIYALVFSLCISIVYAGALTIFEYKIDSRGGQHACASGRICTLDEAVRERVGLMPSMFAVLGIPLSLMAFTAGILMDRFFPRT
jgi:hypothetical protein